MYEREFKYLILISHSMYDGDIYMKNQIATPHQYREKLNTNIVHLRRTSNIVHLNPSVAHESSTIRSLFRDHCSLRPNVSLTNHIMMRAPMLELFITLLTCQQISSLKANRSSFNGGLTSNFDLMIQECCCRAKNC